MLSASLRELVIVVCAMAVVAVLCRWVFTPTHRKAAPRGTPGPVDYGLLAPVARARSAEDALMLRDHLVAQGVRASVNGEHEVLVFQTDLERARQLVAAP